MSDPYRERGCMSSLPVEVEERLPDDALALPRRDRVGNTLVAEVGS